MNEEYQILKDGNNNGRIFWIDDIFFPKNIDLFKRQNLRTFSSYEEIVTAIDELKPITLNDLIIKDEPIYHCLKMLYDIAINLKIGFHVCSFEWADNNLGELQKENTAVLLDVQNIFGEKQEQDEYGLLLAHRINKLESFDRLRFWTRNVTTLRSKAKIKYHIDIPDEFASGPFSGEEGIKNWLAKGLNVKYHDNAIINDIIDFYLNPINQKWGDWGHQDIEDNYMRYVDHCKEWMQLTDKCVEILNEESRGKDNNFDSIKALFLCGEVKEPWRLIRNGDSWGTSRRVNVNIINALLKKLDISLTSHLKDNERFYVPIIPALPFFTALKGSLKFIKPEKILLDRFPGYEGDLFSISMKLPSEKNGYSLAEHFFNYNLETDSIKGGNGCTQALRSLIKCCTPELLNYKPEGNIHLRLFHGDMLNCQCVGPVFSQSWLHLVWSTKSL